MQRCGTRTKSSAIRAETSPGKLSHSTHLYWSKPPYIGRFITSNLGKWLINIVRTHGAIVCVWGDRKWMLSTITVTHILQRGEREHFVELADSQSQSISFPSKLHHLFMSRVESPPKEWVEGGGEEQTTGFARRELSDLEIKTRWGVSWEWARILPRWVPREREKCDTKRRKPPSGGKFNFPSGGAGEFFKSETFHRARDGNFSPFDPFFSSLSPAARRSVEKTYLFFGFRDRRRWKASSSEAK